MVCMAKKYNFGVTSLQHALHVYWCVCTEVRNFDLESRRSLTNPELVAAPCNNSK